jgi:hypothetical protein
MGRVLRRSWRLKNLTDLPLSEFGRPKKKNLKSVL